MDASDAIGEHEPMDELPPASAKSMSTQTDSTRVNHLESDDAAALRHELQELKMRPHVLTADLFKKTDEMVKFYTGLPNWSVFDAVMPLTTPCFPSSKNGKLSIFQKIGMFFMKICLNLYDQDIGHRFSVHRTTVSHTFHQVLEMDDRLSFF